MQLRALTTLLTLSQLGGAIAGNWSQARCLKAANKIERKGCTAPPSWLGVQVSTGCSFEEDDNGLLLVLTGTSNTTTVFTDRPNREAAEVFTYQLAKHATQLFRNDAPNAVVASRVAGQVSSARFVIQLFAPAFDEATGTLTYRVQQSASQQAVAPLELDIAMTSCSVFIE